MTEKHSEKTRTPKIIVCDDEPHIRKLLSEHLSDIGYEVRMAKDGVECMEQYRQDQPDAIILDLKMPNMTGVEVIRELRQEHAKMPILVLSAFHDLGHEVEIKELTLGVFTGKPFRLSEVTDVLETALLEMKDATGADIKIPHNHHEDFIH